MTWKDAVFGTAGFLGYGVNPHAVRRWQEVPLIKSTGYNPDYRFAAALIANAIKAARKIEQVSNHETRVSALKAIAWLSRPGAADQWFEMAGFEHEALAERLPLERWVKLAREHLATDPQLKHAMT